MAEAKAVKKVKVYKKCSGFDVAELKELGLKVKDHTTGCIGKGKCKGSDPALEGKVYGFINGEFVVCETKEDFFDKVKAVL